MDWSNTANETNKLIIDMIISFWPIFVLLAIIAIMKITAEVWIPNYIKNKRTEKRINQVNKWSSDKDLLGKLRKLHPNDFENYIADLYSKLGYKTEKVGGSYDGGVDVIVEKEGIKHYIQCKKYITSKVSVGDVRDFAGALMDKLSRGKGIFITTNIFTTEAVKFAEDKPIELVDGDDLLKLVKLANKENEIIKSKETDICPTCGGKLLEKKGKYGKFFGCSNYPNCRFTKNIIN
ncbi:MAG: restriction endonuclease [Spirochaetes bacterium]|nr:restriction endonuclease [Spirochaetota bacterium]